MTRFVDVWFPYACADTYMCTHTHARAHTHEYPCAHAHTQKISARKGKAEPMAPARPSAVCAPVTPNLVL